MIADLHTHSTYSDGKYTIYELVDYAKERKLDIMALTDHDTVNGDDLAYNYAKEKGLFLLRGIELSTRCDGEMVHIIGLFKNNIVPESLRKVTNDMLLERRNRAIKMMNNISSECNLEIHLDELLKFNSITRKNMLDHIMKYNDINYNDAKKLFSYESKFYIPSNNLSVSDGIKILDDAGAIKILAHPCLVKDEILEKIIDLGFDGMECYYTNPKNDIEKYKKIAKEHNLFISGGSDFHGDNSHGDLKSSYIEDKEVLPILKLLGIEYGN